ncbi:hypothetical protein K437DRAFT_137747 [Tilletiaria anomala UBC 951]|uniref:Uncharacterized protein n=1 Tax=Tilletiaria anomala (strain ATCC 24038 / CBS 436.72 / UBC 951) TaxID=1037660 RepID=A0A066VSS5_TILAU|nr:uncharacterized protein K437DRAFT_137747 [Tilletiaria anomala UBC 951]KDN44516.1 hypothetical protein K437DRAFT_137747 [Tilletiaria anomala UBC 951]
MVLNSINVSMCYVSRVLSFFVPLWVPPPLWGEGGTFRSSLGSLHGNVRLTPRQRLAHTVANMASTSRITLALLRSGTSRSLRLPATAAPLPTCCCSPTSSSISAPFSTTTPTPAKAVAGGKAGKGKAAPASGADEAAAPVVRKPAAQSDVSEYPMPPTRPVIFKWATRSLTLMLHNPLVHIVATHNLSTESLRCIQ